MSSAAETNPTANVPAGLRIRLDQGHPNPRVERAEEALRQLRNRVERHLDQEVCLGRLYQGWEACWTAQCDQLRSQVARLEAHLAAWMPTEPELSLVADE